MPRGRKPPTVDTPLTDRERVFVATYVDTLNGVESAKKSGFKGTPGTLYVTANRVLKKPNVRKAIDQAMAEITVSREEALLRLWQQAQGLHSMAFGGDGKVNLKTLKSLGLMHLVKSITPTRYGDKVEFYDAQNALINILKIYDTIGQLTDVQPITTIEINVPDKR